MSVTSVISLLGIDVLLIASLMRVVVSLAWITRVETVLIVSPSVVVIWRVTGC